MPEKQPIERSNQPVVTCFYSMKKGHSVRFCKIRKYSVPKDIMRWIPKSSEVPIDKAKSKGPTFVRDQILLLEFNVLHGYKKKHGVLSYLIKLLEEKEFVGN